MKILIVLILVLFFASLYDFRRGRIPNLLIAIGAVYGLLRVFYYQNFFSHIPGIVFPVIIFYPLFKIGTMGAGDIKLFSLIGFYVSFMESLYGIFLAFLIGAVLSLLHMKREGNLSDRITYLVSYLKDCVHQNRFLYYYKDIQGKELAKEEIEKTKIHLAIPIFISVCIHLGGGFL